MIQYTSKKSILLVVLLLTTMAAQAQSGLHKVDWRKARIKDVGAYMLDLHLEEQLNNQTQQIDTVMVNRSRMVWQSEGYDVTDIDKNPTLLEGESMDLPEVSTGD